MELVSIIVPVYNVEKYLPRCLDSILEQTYTNFELLLVNDGSTDFSYQICNTYAAQDSRIRVLNKRNGGLASARNFGIRNKRGIYTIFVDSDDYWLSKTILQELVELAVAENLDVVRAEYIEVDENGEPLYDNAIPQNKMSLNRIVMDEAEMLDSVICGKWFVVLSLYKSDILLEFNESQRFQEDIEFNIRMFSQSLKCSYIPLKFYAYRKRAGSLSMQLNLDNVGYSFALCNVFHEYASRTTNNKTADIYNKYSIMQFYWSLRTLALQVDHKTRKDFIRTYNLDDLYSVIRKWRNDNGIHGPFEICFKPIMSCFVIRAVEYFKAVIRNILS